MVVLASACAHNGSTSPSSTASTKAIQVVNFTAVPDTVFESQEPALRLNLKNVGSRQANSVEATLYNVPFGQPSERSWRVGDRSMPVTEEEKTFDFGTLRPANPEAGLPATPRSRTKTLTPPDLSEGERISYDFMARVFYRYSTRATTEIQLMGQQRFREQGRARSQPTMENSDGPVQMGIRTRTPIVFYGDGTTSSNLCLVVRNAGSGTVTWPNDRDTQEVVEVTIRSSGDMEFNSVSGQPNRVELIGNRGVKCYSVSGFEDFQSTDIQRTIPITFEADYGYYKSTESTITVRGRGGSSTGSTDTGSNGGGDETGENEPPPPPE